MPVFSSHLVSNPGAEIGKRIREERALKGLTLRELSTRLDMSQAKLSNIETGKVSVDLEELSRVADLLQGSVAALLKAGVSEEEVGLIELRKTGQRILGNHQIPWCWSYRVRVGVK